MTRGRLVLIAALLLAPVAALAGVGLYALWEAGLALWTWPLLFGSFALAYLLAWRWTRRSSLPPTDAPPPDHWTDRDKRAWELVLAKARSFEALTVEQVQNPKHYADLALDLTAQVAVVYDPGAAGPFDHLTLPEVLACVELAASDLNELVQKYVPGAHLLRLRDLKRARTAAGAYNTASNVVWAGSAVLNPIGTAVRYLLSRLVLGSLLDKVQNNVILWFHGAFVHRFGHYLIELNSGRLRVGARRYRELLARHEPPPDAPAADAAPGPVAVAVLGAVKAGKSSVVNALLGRAAATVDRLPVAAGARYTLPLPDGRALTVHDTSGYGQDGPNEAEFAEAVGAARDADLVVLVTAATSPGRANDVALLDRLAEWFAARPQLKRPAVAVAVTHVDLLSPKAEWDPPYDWQSGARPKERTMRECLDAVREQFGARAAAVVPVCARDGERFGIPDGLLPVLVAQLDAARGAAVLRAIDAEATAGQYRKVGAQVLAAGRAALGALFGPK